MNPISDSLSSLIMERLDRQLLGQNELFAAVQANNIGRVRHFCQTGFDINALDKCDRTPLQAALQACCLKIEMCRALIGLGTNIENKDDEGTTALDHIVYFYKRHRVDSEPELKLFRCLIQAGAKTDGIRHDVLDRNHISTLERIKSHPELFQILLEKLNSTASMNREAFPRYDLRQNELFAAVQADDIDQVRRLCQTGFDINAFDVFKNTPLRAALEARCLKIEMCKALIELGTNIENKDPDDGTTALDHIVYFYRHRLVHPEPEHPQNKTLLELFRCLIQAGAKTDGIRFEIRPISTLERIQRHPELFQILAEKMHRVPRTLIFCAIPAERLKVRQEALEKYRQEFPLSCPFRFQLVLSSDISLEFDLYDLLNGTEHPNLFDLAFANRNKGFNDLKVQDRANLQFIRYSLENLAPRMTKKAVFAFVDYLNGNLKEVSLSDEDLLALVELGLYTLEMDLADQALHCLMGSKIAPAYEKFIEEKLPQIRELS